MTSRGSLTSHTRALPCIARSRARLRDVAAGRGITERSACGIVTGLTAASYMIKHKDGRPTHGQIQTHLPLPGARQPGTRDRRSPGPPCGRRRETAADRDRASLESARSRACMHTLRQTPGAGRPASSGQRALMDPDTGVLPGPDSHTNICREQLAVKISSCAFRCCPVTGSNSRPEYLKSAG